MKKLLLFAFIFSINVSAQTELPTTTSKTFKWEEKEQSKTYEVSLKYLLQDIVITQETLNSVIMNAVIQSKYKLKNRLSFRPIEVMIYGKDNDLKIYVKYSGKNAYGVESLSESYFDFKNEGDGSVNHKLTK